MKIKSNKLKKVKKKTCKEAAIKYERKMKIKLNKVRKLRKQI